MPKRANSEVKGSGKIRGQRGKSKKRTTDITEKEWDEVLSLDLLPAVRRLFEHLKSNDNAIVGSHVRALGISIEDYPAFEDVNRPFELSKKPFVFAPEGDLSDKDRIRDGRYRLYKWVPVVKK